MKDSYSFLDQNNNNIELFKGVIFNKGYISPLLKKSLKELGFGRSILVDKNNRVLSGHKVVAAADELNFKKVRVVDVSGDELVVVRRTDVDSFETKALELSLVDNLIANKTLVWDCNAVINEMKNNLAFDAREYNGYECIVKELNIEDLIKDEVLRQNKVRKKSNNNDYSLNQIKIFE